ncbi:MAG: tetratricopeptide repeat protein [Verrucomicrobia bacterium]|nr:tetratricopeptide repeat protein [Verrucomicrobiota bacterium]
MIWPPCVQHYELALQIKPAYAEAHHNLGSALASQGKLPAAARQYEQALPINPDFALARFNLGNALAGQGKTNEARSHYQQALNLAAAQDNPALAETIRARLK